jgi:hypothetical protein
MRIDWAALPEAVTNEVADRAGGAHIIPATTGDHAEIAATVTGTNGKVFVKAAHTDFGVRSLRFELRVSEAVNGPNSPAVEWHFETSGWLVVGFEHCEGPHAGLSPASPDLDLLGEALTRLGKTPAPDVPLFSPPVRLGFEHPAMAGDTLVHTDLGSANLIVTERGLRIVDWAMATKAAPWVELAMLMPWLISAGHTPEQAEQWLARHPAWWLADPEVLDYFATKNAQKWASKSAGSAAGWMRDLAGWTSQWAAYRHRNGKAPIDRSEPHDRLTAGRTPAPPAISRRLQRRHGYLGCDEPGTALARRNERDRGSGDGDEHSQIGEELAGVAMAWAGTTGQNPRKGVTHTLHDVAGELGDVAFTALATVASLGFDPEAVLVGVARKAVDRLGETACETAAPQ